MNIDIANPDDRARMVSAIGNMIQSTLDDKSINQHAELILDEYIVRTNHHVWLVGQCAKILRDIIIRAGQDVEMFDTNIEFHDYDKLHNDAILPSYALACHYFYFHNKDVKYKVDEEWLKHEFEDVAWPKHHQNNKHHYAEFYGKINNAGVLDVPETYDILNLVEMYADWMAMGITNGGTAHEWWTKNYGPENKFDFHGRDLGIIQQCISAEDNAVNQLAYLRQFKDVEPTWVPPTEIETFEEEDPLTTKAINEGIENFFNYESNESLSLKRDDLYIGPIDPMIIDPEKMMKLAEYPELLLDLKKWTTTPDHNLSPSLIYFGKIIDDLYQFKKPIVCYRGIRTGFSTRPKQNLMGAIDDEIEYLRLLKPGFDKPGQTFEFESPEPMSLARSPYIAKIYGNYIVKTEVPVDANKLVITPELAYLLQQMEVEYPEYRAVNLSVTHEVIVFAGTKLNFEIVSVFGDISSELETMKEHSFEGLGNTEMNGVYFNIFETNQRDTSTEALSDKESDVSISKYNGSKEELEIIRQCVNLSARSIDPKGEGYDKTTFEKLVNNKDKGPYWIIRNGNDIIGSVSIRFSTVGADEVHKCSVINDFAILEKYQGKGLGKKALLAIIEYIRKTMKYKDIGLGVGENNTKAISLYKSVGFKRICGASWGEGDQKFIGHQMLLKYEDSSTEALKSFGDFANTSEKRTIKQLVDKYYDKVGSHGWNHISEVLATAEKLVKRSLTLIEYTAVVCHDLARKELDEGHPARSVEIAKEILPGTNLFSTEELKEIYKAIGAHGNKHEFASELCELVACADRCFPKTTIEDLYERPILWMLEGSDKGKPTEKEYNVSDDLSIATRAVSQIKKWCGDIYDKAVKEDNLYTRTFKNELKKTQDLANNTRPEQVVPVVKKLRSSFSLESLSTKEYTESDINSAEDLKQFYKHCSYGLIDFKANKPWKETHKNTTFEDWEKEWRLLSVEQLLKFKCGICYDTAKANDYFLTKWKIDHVNLFAYTKRSAGDDYDDDPTHTFTVYKDTDGKWKWLEGSWGSFKNNDWSESSSDALIKNIGKALANEAGVTNLIGVITSWPRDGVSMNEFYHALKDQTIKRYKYEIEPDASYSKEALTSDTIYLIGSTNAGKLAEYSSIFGKMEIKFTNPSKVGGIPDVDENQSTYKGNAEKKAKEIAAAKKMYVLADDSGLSVDALNGEPGIMSGRYAGDSDHNSSANYKLVLKKLEGQKNRKAKYVTALSLADEHGIIKTVIGELHGTIAEEARGSNGFSYDVIFIPDGYNKTIAEMTNDEKNEISHRRKAITLMADYISKHMKTESSSGGLNNEPSKKKITFPKKVSDPETSSNEALAEKAIKDGLLYHGSCQKYDVLKPQPQKDVDDKRAISLSPYKRIASMFTVPVSEIGKGKYKRRMIKIEDWFEDRKDVDMYAPIKEVHIWHNMKDQPKIDKICKGYIYTIKAEEALADSSDNPKWKGSEEVLSYVKELHPIKVEETHIRLIAEYNPKKAGVDHDAIPVNETGLEALAPDIKKKKQLIIDYICSVCDIMDPSKLNSKRYHRLLDSMSDKEFDQWMQYVKDGKWKIHIVAPNLVVTLKNENSLKAADKVKCKLFHRLWMTDDSTGRQYLTDNEYLVLNLPVRRQQQFLDEKMSVPDNDKQIDGMTGQVTGDSKSSAVTNPEIQILAARGLDATLEEFVNVRGGNIAAYSDFKRQAEETGEIKLNSLDPNTRSRVAVVGQVLLRSMMIENNILE